MKSSRRECKAHCKKCLVIFPSLPDCHIAKHSLAGNYLIIPGQGEFGSWHRWGRENCLHFLQCAVRGVIDVVKCTVHCKKMFSSAYACDASLAKLVTSLPGWRKSPEILLSNLLSDPNRKNDFSSVSPLFFIHPLSVVLFSVFLHTFLYFVLHFFLLFFSFSIKNCPKLQHCLLHATSILCFCTFWTFRLLELQL